MFNDEDMTTSTAGKIAIAIIPMVTGTLSISASSTIIAKVLQSQSKLTTPYNRLLIGLCVFDIKVSSCSVIFNPTSAERRTRILGCNWEWHNIPDSRISYHVLGHEHTVLQPCSVYLLLMCHQVFNDRSEIS